MKINSKLAGILAVCIIVMNFFPFVAFANMKAPDLQKAVPNYKSPNLEAPDLQKAVPNYEPPNLEGPDLQRAVPNYESPNIEAPDLQKAIPKYESPKLEAPGLQEAVPNGENPSLKSPDLQRDGPNINDPTSELNVPNLEIQNPNDISNGTLETRDFDPKPAQFIKYGFRDYTSGSLKYIGTVMKDGEVDEWSQLLKGSYLFKGKLALSASNIALGGEGFAGQANMVAMDVLGGKGVLSDINKVRAVTPSAPLPKLNAVTAGLSLLGDGFYTGYSFSQAYTTDPTNGITEDERDKMFQHGVGALGQTMMDAGMIAAVVPGGQAVAGTLMIAGGILYGTSLLLKYADRSNAVTRRLRKGAGKVGKAIGKGLGKIGDGIKSLFSN
ncbi:hypothetical protein LC040_06785 [Bacillus tianshenii]|nr:hypothetical protein LC040_06785 [Bacillus tianshenii]